MKRLKTETVYSGTGDAIGADYTYDLRTAMGYCWRPVLYVQAIGGTGACAFTVSGGPNSSPDAADLAANNRFALLEPNEAAATESQNVTTAASPGTKRNYHVVSCAGSVSASWQAIASDYLYIDVGTNTWDSDVVALVELYFFGG